MFPALLGFAALLERAEARQALDRGFHVLDRDQPRAFELAWGIFVARAPQKVFVLEAQMRIVPAPVASMIVDDAIGRRKLVDRMGEAGDHHHRRSHGPSKPR